MAMKRIRAAPPGVAVGDLFEEVRLLVEGLAADLDVHAEIRAHVEGRVDVDQLEAAGVLDLPAQRARLEGRQDQLVVAPDELVGPALELPAAAVEQFLAASLVSVRGSSTCSSVWKGSTVVQTSRVLPFQTSSTSRLSSNRMKRYFSGSGLPCWIRVDQVALLGVAQFVGFLSCCRVIAQSSWYSRKALDQSANDDGLCCSKPS